MAQQMSLVVRSTLESRPIRVNGSKAGLHDVSRWLERWEFDCEDEVDRTSRGVAIGKVYNRLTVWGRSGKQKRPRREQFILHTVPVLQLEGVIHTVSSFTMSWLFGALQGEPALLPARLHLLLLNDVECMHIQWQSRAQGREWMTLKRWSKYRTGYSHWPEWISQFTNKWDNTIYVGLHTIKY